MVSGIPLNNLPLVSVVMPAYNASAYIADAIESILNQTYNKFELIIVDDCSRDGTADIIKKYAKRDKRIIFLQNKKNLKLSKTLNYGIEMAKGKYIARMDADDYSYHDRLEKQVSYFERHPTVGILGGSMEMFTTENKIIGIRKYPTQDNEIRKNLYWFSPFSHPLIMIRKAVLDTVGYYNDYYNPAEDYELYFRIGKVSEFANLKDTLLRYRIVSKSMTTGNTKNMELKTIEIRDLYSKDAMYPMTLIQHLYNLVHKLSLYIVPSTLKMKTFHFIRNNLK